MKKIAAILLLIFALVQVAPAVSSLFTASSTVLVIDEEKGDQKTETEKKDKKDYSTISFCSESLSNRINTAFHQAEKIHSSPCLEKPTPPPNFC